VWCHFHPFSRILCILLSIAGRSLIPLYPIKNAIAGPASIPKLNMCNIGGIKNSAVTTANIKVNPNSCLALFLSINQCICPPLGVLPFSFFLL